MGKKREEFISFAVRHGELRQITRAAALMGISRSQFIRDSVSHAVAVVLSYERRAKAKRAESAPPDPR